MAPRSNTRSRPYFRGSRGGSSFRGQRGRGRGGSSAARSNAAPKQDDEGTRLAERFEQVDLYDDIDDKLGFSRTQEGPKKEGSWDLSFQNNTFCLCFCDTMSADIRYSKTIVKDPDWPGGRAAVDYYFIQEDGKMFKCTMNYEPYFYISCVVGMETIVEEWLIKKYEGVIYRIVRERKEDLKMPNHLLGHRRLFLQLCFRNVSDLLTVRRDIMPLALANGAKRNAIDAYAEVVNATENSHMDIDSPWGAEAGTSTARDKDPRDAIIDIREFDVPYYLRVAMDNEIRVGLWYTVTFNAGQPTLTQLTERVKRPDPVVMAYDIETTKAPLKFPDQAIDQLSHHNREIVSEDIEDFEYTPKEGYEGPFIVFNEADEKSTIERFFRHIRDVKPTVMATFNGDFFDFPFLCARAKTHEIDMFLETGFAIDSEDEFKSRCCVHMDCFRWVKRDSYLPQGSQGLKAVTVAKLGYDPIELDPELMTPYAMEQPQILAQYSVSDAVATYYLYMKYVHPFIFSLCNIIPLCPDEVLRKGSGTLCETLLMVEAFRGHIIMPNRHEEEYGNMYEGHLLASETYVGGHVEALEAGVFRSDIETHFKIVPSAAQKLIDELDAALTFCILEEFKISLEDVTNYDTVKAQIQASLEELRDNPLRTDRPLIYHLDVAAMYPNIMLSNRLQPDSVVDESVCAVCDFNRPGKTCDRRLTWAWRGEFFPARRDELNMIRHALNQESFPPKRPGDPQRRFPDLSQAEQTALTHKRLGDYSRKVYKKMKTTKVENRETIICQRENPFYVDTVRRFRDRRYEYKGLLKTWKKNLDAILAEGKPLAEVDEARKLVVVYDSLQLAHKCILNSFYGYVMRKGARWHSMEMAGVTCLTGATIIQMARQLVEQIGRPLELDTDGIWCMLPGFTNHQYHDFDPETGDYKVHSENSIFFELDGPYKAMILPSSKEEDKLLKKRYAVFNDDGSLAELKEECYAAVAEVADRWLDVLFSQAADLSDEELVDLIAENRSMSKTLAEYGGQKSTSISTAKRLAEFWGTRWSRTKVWLATSGAPVTERAVPVAIFSAEESVKRTYLRKALGSVIQKLITIPAAMQKVTNPVPRIHHPDWLFKRVAALDDKFHQHKMTDFFGSAAPGTEPTQPADIEDIGDPDKSSHRHRIAVVNRKPRKNLVPASEKDDISSRPLPDPSRNYSAWIRAMRPRWGQRRRMRTVNADSTTVPSMFRGVTKSKTTSRWDIIQLRPTRSPGRYDLWLSVDAELVSIPLRIPREFYLHLRVDLPDGLFRSDLYEWEKVTRSLPRNMPCTNLYKIITREDVYQENQEHFVDLTNYPNVDGIFELQVPLTIRSILKLGKTCTAADNAITLNRAGITGLEMNQLEMGSPSPRSRYLDEGKAGKYLFLYHACSVNAPIHVFALFLPTGNVRLHIVDPATRRQPIPRLREAYSDLRQQQHVKHGRCISMNYPESREFSSTYHSTDLTALKAISRELGLLENQSFTVVISSMKDHVYFSRSVPRLTRFPVLSMSKARAPHSLDVFPWQTNVAQKLCQRYLSLGPWIDRMTALAEYYDMPIGHIDGDQPLLLSDVVFARRLVGQDMVLWWSPSGRPDLGGLEDDSRPTEELPNTEFITPGCYSNVCLEVSVRNLSVNSILHAMAVNELEGSGGTTAFDSVSHTIEELADGEVQRDLTLGESNVSTQTFGIIKSMVKAWLLDKVRYGFESPATLAIDHFWRWISSKASHMYDPSIHRFVHSLMRKTFIQLLAEFKRLGSQVIYADFSRLLLVTSKPPGTAHAYATYITTAVTSNELFQHMYLNTERFYDFLLFMDQANAGGIVCEDPLSVDLPEELVVEMRWNIELFLPPAIQGEFTDLVRYFLLEMYKAARKEGQRAPLRVLANGAPDMTQPDANKVRERDTVRDFISRRLTRKLFRAIETVQTRVRAAIGDPEAERELSFPLLPGSHLTLTDPVAELTKFACAVFALASPFEKEVGLLSRNALELVGVNAFGEEAAFRNPCAPLRLMGVPCRHCDALRDFDFCRDADLLPRPGESGRPRWACTRCGAEHDRTAVEFELIERVHALERAAAQQDLRCARCAQVRADHVARLHDCGGSFNNTVNRTDMRRALRTMVNVAIVHDLSRLRETAQAMLDNS
ncbi:hypothetical protein BJV77DRAFT_958771 [Russula vinacea]|nr:hypothetical protein BJV77DRAFT_958771 [Russula vinacea]